MMKSASRKCVVFLLFVTRVAVVVSQGPQCNNDNDCLNGGNCNNDRCNCDGLYFGVRCQYKNTEVCNNDNDCRNGGDCRNSVCVCRDYWYGGTCERVCPGDPPLCLNGGSCVVDPSRNDGFDCQCINDITGRFCETEEEAECDPPCLNGGTCDGISEPESPYCICPVGFTGSQCEGGTSTGPCSSGPCLNGGTCFNLPNNVFFCACPVNYGGNRCMDFVPPPNPCDSTPCMNGGTCEVNTGGIEYSCTCNQGYTGIDCGTVENPCDPNPCENGGSCTALDSTSFICECPSGFSGTICQAQSLPCDPNPCANGGTCTAQGTNSYTCSCTTGFSGTTCQAGGDGGNNATGFNTQTIIIIAGGGGLALIVLVIVFMCVICLCFVRRKKPSHRSKKSKAKRMTTIPPADDHRRLHHPHGNNKHHPENNYVAMTTKRKTMEFPRTNLRFLEHIGSGAFASVYKAEAYAILKPRKKTLVAVKALKENASENDRKDFMKELALFKALGKHENLVTMYGCCTDKDPVYLIMEYLSKGNLQQHLRSMVNGGGGTYTNKMADNQLSPSELLSFGIQISKGMEFLHSKQCVHRDLAARNILLDEDAVCKISDFGLARDVADSQEYEMKSKGRVPVRWMAPESLMQNLYTTKSDAWSFGIVMWEIVTLGSHPYPGMSPRQVMQSVQNGYRLPQPDHCNDQIYGVLEQCWKEDPADRPSFTEIRMSLEDMMEADQGYLQMDNFHQDNYVYLEPEAALAEEL